MLLSVVVYNHTLTPGQWLGAAVVFAGISVEAWVKRKGERVFASQRRSSVVPVDSPSPASGTLLCPHRCAREARDAGEGEGEDQAAVMSPGSCGPELGMFAVCCFCISTLT